MSNEKPKKPLKSDCENIAEYYKLLSEYWADMYAILWGECEKARGIQQECSSNEKLLNQIREAIQGYYTALDNREHGGVAQHKAFEDIERILGMIWPNI